MSISKIPNNSWMRNKTEKKWAKGRNGEIESISPRHKMIKTTKSQTGLRDYDKSHEKNPYGHEHNI
jgi:hypothetical protein